MKMKKKQKQRALTLTVTGSSLLFAAAAAQGALVSYHDFGATTGFESTGNITTHQSGGAGVSNNAVDLSLKQLIDFSSGAPTGIFINITDANGMDSRNGGQYLPPAAGTPADALFNVAGLNLNNGAINEQNGQTTLTLTGLSPTKIYDIALYGDRTAASDGVERFTLGGAVTAVNSSSTGIINAFTTDQNTRPNSAAGNVIRYTNILAGGDGTITIAMDPTVTSATNVGYLMALRLEESAPPPFVAYHDLGATIGSESTGNITTHQSGTAVTSNNALDTSAKQLIRYADGVGTGVFVSIAGANGMDSRSPNITAPPSAGHQWQVAIPSVMEASDQQPLAQLWARERIDNLRVRLGDHDQLANRLHGHSNAEHDMVSLAKRYELLTPETTFVAIEERHGENKVNEKASLRRVPLMLPSGWHGIESVDAMLDITMVCSKKSSSPILRSRKVGNVGDGTLSLFRSPGQGWIRLS